MHKTLLIGIKAQYVHIPGRGPAGRKQSVNPRNISEGQQQRLLKRSPMRVLELHGICLELSLNL
jgi:hypothetical protein